MYSSQLKEDKAEAIMGYVGFGLLSVAFTAAVCYVVPTFQKAATTLDPAASPIVQLVGPAPAR